MLTETILVSALLTTAGVLLAKSSLTGASLYVPLTVSIVLQGCWFHRLYTIGHEAVHRKLAPSHKLLNDVIGQALLLPLLIPVPIYRKIHKFHHRHNRRDHHTSTLDGYVVRGRLGFLERAWINACWYVGVFAGGYFLHGVVSILLFMFIPPSVAVRISPAFKGWRWRDQGLSAVLFFGAIGAHVGFAALLGVRAWVFAVGAPLLFFAWIYSMLVYIYHYDTTYGDEVWLNVRSVEDAHPFFEWWLLNFNHHRVHHRYPTKPWYVLPEEPATLPETHAHNENVHGIAQAIRQLARGPAIFVEEEARGE